MDTPDFAPTFPGAFQENSRLRSDRSVSPNEAPFLCCSKEKLNLFDDYNLTLL